MSDGPIRTVITPSSAVFQTKGSRFICYLAPAESETEVVEIVETVADDHPDATHVVWARRLSGEPVDERASDAGEPGGSAGQPALNVLRNEELLDTVAVIVRYYGGTNLGYGGLVRAYSRAVRDAISAADTETRFPTSTVEIASSYDDSGTIRGVLDSEAVTYEARYEETVTFVTSMPTNRLEDVLDRIRSATGGRASIDH